MFGFGRIGGRLAVVWCLSDDITPTVAFGLERDCIARPSEPHSRSSPIHEPSPPSNSTVSGWFLESRNHIHLLRRCRPTPESTADVLQQSNNQFMKSDESAFSIVPSRLSSRISFSTSQTSRRTSSDSYTKLAYRPLFFENDLFTARVYKRNYRNSRSQPQQRGEPNHEYGTIVPEGRKRKQNEAVLKLKLQSCSQGKTTTTIAANNLNAYGDAELIVPSGIMVSTIHNVSLTEELEGDLEHRVGSSSSGQDGLYVRLSKNLEHRISPSASASYIKIVMACSSGDNKTVKEELAAMPTALASYISGSFYFCPIHAAVFNDHVDVMRTLLSHAALKGDLDLVVEKTIGGTEIDRWRPLHVATSKGNLPMVKLLLEKGATVLSKTGHGIQAAHLAARIGSISILEALFDAGAQVNCTDLRGYQPIHYISDSQDSPQVVEYLLKRGADTHSADGTDELSPLHMACKHDFSGNLKALLSFGALGGEYISCSLESALDTAIRCGSSLSVQTLLEYGVSPSKCCHDGRSGLHTFVSRYCGTSKGEDPANLMILRLLLEHIELLVFDDSGETVLDSLFRLGSKTEIARLFLKHLPKDKVVEREKLASVIYWSP